MSKTNTMEEELKLKIAEIIDSLFYPDINHRQPYQATEDICKHITTSQIKMLDKTNTGIIGEDDVKLPLESGGYRKYVREIRNGFRAEQRQKLQAQKSILEGKLK